MSWASWSLRSAGSSGSVEAGSVALQRCTTTFKVTVFRSRKTKQVLCVEADKDFVDTLFSFLLLPIGTILHLTQEIQIKRLGGMSSIYGSVDPSILLVDKEELTQPRPSYLGCTCGPNCSLHFHQELVGANLLRSPLRKKGVTLPQEFYRCTSNENTSPCWGSTLSSDLGASCSLCKAHGYSNRYSEGPYSVQLQDQFQHENGPEGFVKKNLKFIVTDKLEIMPITKTAFMSVFEEFGMETSVTVTQILQLLRSSLTSNTCLTDVFGRAED